MMIRNINRDPPQVISAHFNPVHYSSPDVPIESIRMAFPEEVIRHEMIFSEYADMHDDIDRIISDLRIYFAETPNGLRLQSSVPLLAIPAVFQMVYAGTDVITKNHGRAWNEALEIASRLTDRRFEVMDGNIDGPALLKAAVESGRKIVDPAIPNANAMYFRAVRDRIDYRRDDFRYIVFSPDVPDSIIPVVEMVTGIDRYVISSPHEPKEAMIPIMAGTMYVSGFAIGDRGITDPALVRRIRDGSVEIVDAGVSGIVLMRDHP